VGENTFEWKDAKITVHTQTGLDELDTDIVLYKLGSPTDLVGSYHARTFARILTQSEVKGDLGFPWPQRSADGEALKVGMAGLLAATGGLVKRWVSELNNVDIAPGDPDIAPGADEKKAKSPKNS
jgi:hypothetical protein